MGEGRSVLVDVAGPGGGRAVGSRVRSPVGASRRSSSAGNVWISLVGIAVGLLVGAGLFFYLIR